MIPRSGPLACSVATGLWLLIVAPSIAQARGPEDVSPVSAAEDEARSRYRRGLELYDEGDYRLALVELERAYSLVPSFKIFYNVGQIRYQLNEYAKAYVAFSRYLSEGGAEVPASRRAEVEKSLAALQTRTATVSVRSSVAGAEISINEEARGAAPVDHLLVDAGALRIVVSKPGYESAARSLTLAGGDELTVDIPLRALESKAVIGSGSSGIPPLAIAGWVATGVFAAGAVATGIATNASASQYEANRNAPIQGSPEEADAVLSRQRQTVRALAITTDALIGAAALSCGISLYLTLRSHPKPDVARVSLHPTGATFSLGF